MASSRLTSKEQYTTQYNGLVVHNNLMDLYKPTASFISNYVHMTMSPQFFGDEYLVHGVHLGIDWDPSAHSIALVVSDWGNEAELRALLGSLRASYHPFREVIVFRPPSSLPDVLQSIEPVTVNGTVIGNMAIKYVQRTDEAYNDWCVVWRVVCDGWCAVCRVSRWVHGCRVYTVCRMICGEWCVSGSCIRCRVPRRRPPLPTQAQSRSITADVWRWALSTD